MEGASNAGTTSSSIAETGLGMTGTTIHAVDNEEFCSIGKDDPVRDHFMEVYLSVAEPRMATIFRSLPAPVVSFSVSSSLPSFNSSALK